MVNFFCLKKIGCNKERACYMKYREAPPWSCAQVPNKQHFDSEPCFFQVYKERFVGFLSILKKMRTLTEGRDQGGY